LHHGDRLDAIVYPQDLVDGSKMKLDRIGTERESSGDVVIGAARDEMREDRALPVIQSVGSAATIAS
jgi:hypothetical protein